MKSILKIIFLSLLLSGTLQSQVPSYTVLTPKQNYPVPKEGAVVLSPVNFGEYHYVAKQYDTLRKEVITLEKVIKQQDSVQCEVNENYERLLVIKDKSIEDYRNATNSFKTISNECATEKTQLQTDYKKLEQKNYRTKHWRNIFLGTSLLSTGLLVLLIAI